MVRGPVQPAPLRCTFRDDAGAGFADEHVGEAHVQLHALSVPNQVHVIVAVAIRGPRPKWVEQFVLSLRTRSICLRRRGCCCCWSISRGSRVPGSGCRHIPATMHTNPTAHQPH
jgi:hypothetical protein